MMNRARTAIVGALLGLLLGLPVACDPDQPSLGPSFTFTVFSGAQVVVDRSFPEQPVRLVMQGEVIYFDDISEMVLDDADVTIHVEGEMIAEADCQTVFLEDPAGPDGRVRIEIRCEFPKDEIAPGCSSSAVTLSVQIKSNIGYGDVQVNALAVTCLADRRMPEVLALESEGAPPGKPCASNDSVSEQRYGYRGGRVRFYDTYDSGVFSDRTAFERGPSGEVIRVVKVGADGLRFYDRRYTYSQRGFEVVTTREPSGTNSRCTYDFGDSTAKWVRDCGEGLTSGQWNRSARTITRTLKGEEFVLSFAGDLTSLTEWLTEPSAGFINILHPLRDEGIANGMSVVQHYRYDDNGRLVSSWVSIADAEQGGAVSYSYGCDGA